MKTLNVTITLPNGTVLANASIEVPETTKRLSICVLEKASEHPCIRNEVEQLSTGDLTKDV